MSKLIIFFMLLIGIMSIHVFHQANLQSASLASFRNAELLKHNLYRAKHGSLSIKLSDTLNAAAQEYAEKIAAAHNMVHSPQAQRGKYGENLYWGWASPTLNYKYGTASDSWYSEVKYYDYSTGKSNTSGKAVGHFTAMIWKSVTTVGFGYASVPEKGGFAVYVVANYSPTPNVQGRYQENV